MLNKYVKYYLKNKPPFFCMIRGKELEFYEKTLPKDKGLKVLDFGIGDGFYLDTFLKFNKRDWHITGVDISRSELNKAEKYKITEQLDDYDGLKLPYKDKSFDLVISNCVLEHVSDIKLNVKEIARVLKPGGRFITTVMSKEWDSYLFGAIFLGKLYTKYMRAKQVHKNLFSGREWTNIFASAGLKAEIKKGYMNRKAGMLMDIMHYVSIPSL